MAKSDPLPTQGDVQMQVKPLLESHSLGGRIAAGCPSGIRGSGPDGGCDGQRGNASVLTKGMNPADRLAGDASTIPHWSPPTLGAIARMASFQTGVGGLLA
jgi:hypothetical protein